MFYSQFILAKKGPLGTIWIAAHLERKLRKNQVADTDIGVSVDSILFPEVPIALRLSSHLLLGVVRIYSKKVSYLFDDCSEALLKVKQAFRSAAVDLPPEESKAPYHSITLPETFDLDDFELPDNDILQGTYVDHHVSAREQITLQDPMDGVVFSTSQFGLDERFGDGDSCQIALDLEEELLLDKGATSGYQEILQSPTTMESSAEPSSPYKGAKSDVETYGSPMVADVNPLDVQVPSTPGLMEEPSLPSAQDAHISDDPMDMDKESNEFVGKEVFGPASGKLEAYLEDNNTVQPPSKENDQLHYPEAEKADDRFPLANGTPASLGLEEMGYIENGSLAGNEPTVASCFQSKEDHGKRNMEGETRMAACDPIDSFSSKFHVGGCFSLVSDENNISNIDKSSVDGGTLGSIEARGNTHDRTSQHEDTEGPACSKPEHSGAHESISADSAPTIPTCNLQHETAHGSLFSASSCVLQACNAHPDDSNVRPDNTTISANLQALELGFSAPETSGKAVLPNISMASTVVQDLQRPMLMSDQSGYPACLSSTAADHSRLDGQVDSLMIDDSLSRKENSAAVTNAPSPEILLCVPDAGRSNQLLVDSTPAKEMFAEGDGDSTANITSRKKRSFTESTLTFQSITSAESFPATQSKTSVESIPNDDDLLSSILAGKRSSVLRLKPTPVQDVESTKRRRVTPRTTPYKRKVLMDDSMVLHGDTIRHQLTSTEDIRRLRKKAPCTRPEIWRLQKQFLEDEIFLEPLLSGMSAEMILVHSQPFDLNGVRIVIDKSNDADLPASNEIALWSRSGDTQDRIDKNNLESVTKDVSEQHAEESVIRQSNADSLTLNPVSLQQEAMLLFDAEQGHRTSHQDTLSVAEALGNETRSSPAGDGVELSVSYISPALLEDIISPHDLILTASLTKVKGTDASVCKDAEVGVKTDLVFRSTDQELDSRHATKASAVDVPGMGEKKGIDCNLTDQFYEDELGKVPNEVPFMEQLEGFDSIRTDIGTHVDNSSHADDASAFGNMAPESRGLAASDQALGVGAGDQSNPGSKDEILGSKQQCDDGIFNYRDVTSTIDSSLVEGYLDQEMMEPTTASNHIIDDHVGFETRFEHDTDFLNFDDDDGNDDDGDISAPNAEESGVQENIGWSSRARAVANYLQILFHKEAQQGRTAIQLDNLLAGKSRKEASRMFFETLVLKTRDYIHVEQEDPFCDIRIKPRHLLMKSEF
ncbi:Sister chromatid cohesion 1 protein 4-like protein [Drosera capensis]